MPGPLRIRWNVDEREWDTAKLISEREAPGSEYDNARYARDDLLYCRLWFEEETAHVEVFDEFPQDWQLRHKLDLSEIAIENTSFVYGFYVQLLDFALQLAPADTNEHLAARLKTGFDVFESMGPLHLRFIAEGNDVLIYSWDSPGYRQRVNAAEFISAIDTFLREVVASVDSRAPLLLTWDSMRQLLPYVSDDAPTPSPR